MNISDLTISVDGVGIAINKNRNYKFINSMNNEYRYCKGVERRDKVREDIKKAVPKEVLLFALNKVYEKIKVDSDWITE